MSWPVGRARCVGLGRLAAVAGAVVVSMVWVTGSAAVARAGEYEVYSCRTPAGSIAPTEGWSGSVSGVYDADPNTCAAGGGMLAGLDSGIAHAGDTDVASWVFNAPSGEIVAAATLWRAGITPGGANENGSYMFDLTGISNSGPTTQVFDSCVAIQCSAEGSLSEPLASSNAVVVPENALKSTFLSLNALCGSLTESSCPPTGPPAGYAAEIELFAADIVLDQQQGPSIESVGGALSEASTVSGNTDIALRASDPVSGVYEALFAVDGQLVATAPLDEENSHCRSVGQGAGGVPAFLYLRPCAASVSVDVPFNTTALSNGMHHLVVSVTDPAGNAAVALEREITVDNPATTAPEVDAGGGATTATTTGGTTTGTTTTGSTTTGAGTTTGGGTTTGTSTGGATTGTNAAGTMTGATGAAATTGTTGTGATTGATTGGGTNPAEATTGAAATTEPAGETATAPGTSSTAAQVASNGEGVSSIAGLSAGWHGSTAERVTTRFGRAPRIEGRLSTQAGRGIAGAEIEVTEVPQRLGANPIALAKVRTSSDGRWVLSLPRDISSSTLRFSYKADPDDALPAATRTLNLVVQAGLRLRITPLTSSLGHSIHFSGLLQGGQIPPGGKQLVLEARSPGGRWIEFDVIHTDAHGRFHATYRFRLPGPEQYQFRALSKREADFPFAEGVSNIVGVSER